MLPRKFALFPVIVLCMALSGCAVIGRWRSKPKPLPAGPRQIGVISMVNTDLGFVLINATEMPMPGKLLKSLSQQGDQTAVLKASPEQKPPFATADITSGSPQLGDRVCQ